MFVLLRNTSLFLNTFVDDLKTLRMLMTLTKLTTSTTLTALTTLMTLMLFKFSSFLKEGHVSMHLQIGHGQH